MTGRFLPTLVAIFALAMPSAALAQTDPTSDYTDTTPTATTPPPAPTTTEEETPAPPPEEEDDAQTTVQAETAESAPAPAPAPAPVAATGTAPTTLAYTGSEAWLFGLVGLLALAGGVALMRTSRRA